MKNLENHQSIVAFIDILGFKEIVKENNKSKDYNILNQLKEALHLSINKSIVVMKEWLKAFGEIENENLDAKLKYRQFSDNLYFSFDYKDDKSDYELAVYLVTSIAAFYQRNMLSKHFYIRGGIADGQNYCDEHMIFSSALIKAYEFETRTAIYPRIIIDPKILKSLPKDNIINKLLPNIFVMDWAGLIFLNPFKIITSVNNILAQFPNISNDLIKIKNKNTSLLTLEDTLYLEPDISDEILANNVKDNLELKLRKYKNIPEFYEKYLWLKEFLLWQHNHKGNLNFKYR
ncbi:MAG: hypothetical protein IPH98_08350 [Saprospiraceae bacterium]|nr:hypothetical protein [Candidatus Defluviibacterium haderslevense]